VVLKGSATTGVAVRAGQAATCVWNGSDFEIVASGDVDGPSSATDNAIARFDLTTGKLIQNSGVTIDDSNNVSGVVQLNATTVAATTGNITTVNATTVDTTNIEVTNLKAKDGTAAGSIADSTGIVTLASSVLTTTDINGGTIDGVTIGGASAGAGTFTSLTDSGNLTFTGTGNRILGDFSNATVASRVMFQSSTVNGATQTALIPNGTATASAIEFYNGSDPANAQVGQLLQNANEFRISATFRGTPLSGTYLPITFATGGSERVRIDTSGNVGIGTSSSSGKLHISSGTTTNPTNIFSQGYIADGAADTRCGTIRNTFDTNTAFGTYWTAFRGANGTPLQARFGVRANNVDTDVMTLDSSGNVGIGTVSPGARLDVTGASGGQDIAVRAPASASATLDLAGNGNTVGSTSFTIRQDTSGSALLFNRANTSMLFATNGTERMRIDSSGNFMVGTASDVGGSRLVVVSAGNTSATNAVVLRNSSSANLLYLRDDGLINTGLAALSPYNNTTGDAANMVVGSDGFLYRSTSSLKYKTDVNDATHGLSKLLTLRPVTYKGTNDGDKVFGGLIAEEVDKAGLTEFVQYAEDGTPDALAYGNMVSLCIKAIQEMKAIIDFQAERITALEAK
jgi:hypothetical protein